MNALAGSQEAGAAQMKFLREETNRLGQDFMSTAEAYKNLFSSGKGAGMADSDIQSIFSGVLEAGTVLGSSQQQLQGALTALEQMISKGKVSTQELRLQLGNALPGAMQIAARAMGVTNQEFQKMLESGLDSQKFVMAFANQLHTEFAGKATDASHTLRAELARLQNSVFNLETSLLDGEAGKEFGELVAQVTKLLSSSAFKQSLKLVSQLLTVVLKNIRLIGGIAAIMGIRRLIQTVAMLRLEFLTTTFAAGSLQAALQMDAGIASIKALTKASWGLLAPWLRIIAVLLLVIEALDTIRGKKTVTRDLMNANPLAPKHATNFLDQHREEHPWLTGIGDYAVHGLSMSPLGVMGMGLFRGSQHLMKDAKNIPQRGAVYNQTNNQNAFTFNIKSDEPKAVANEVKATMLNVFTNFGTGKGFPQGAR
jgi:tape measure domain-containing protein